MDYFNETNTINCGICSNCLKKKDIEENELSMHEKRILKILKNKSKTSRALQLELQIDADLIKKILKELTDNETILIEDDFTYKLNEK